MTVTSTSPLIVPEFDLADRCIKARKVGQFKRQEDLAEASGISVRTISRYENGETTKPNRSILRQWALSCGVPFDWLAGESFTSRGSSTRRNRNTRRAVSPGNTRPGGTQGPATTARPVAA